MVPEDVRNYITHLAMQRRVSSSTQNQALQAILFLFRHVLGQELTGMDTNVRAKRGRKLPSVLWPEEVTRLLECVPEKQWLPVALLYGAGMRLMELCRLRVKDIDFGGNCIVVRSGKGDKDRVTILPESLREPLHEHLAGMLACPDQTWRKSSGHRAGGGARSRHTCR